VQFAQLQALEIWTSAGVPQKPSAWLYQVARNHLLGQLRQSADRQRILARFTPELTHSPGEETAHRLPGEMQDDLLLMLFAENSLWFQCG